MAAKRRTPSDPAETAPEDTGLVEQLKSAIRSSGLTLREVARRATVDSGLVSRFMRGERDIELSTAEKICSALRLRLTPSEQTTPTAPPP